MQAELTDERIAEMMTAGKWKLPEHEKILETLERDDQLKQILPYIQEVQGGFKEGLFPSSSFATCRRSRGSGFCSVCQCFVDKTQQRRFR